MTFINFLSYIRNTTIQITWRLPTSYPISEIQQSKLHDVYQLPILYQKYNNPNYMTFINFLSYIRNTTIQITWSLPTSCPISEKQQSKLHDVYQLPILYQKYNNPNYMTFTNFLSYIRNTMIQITLRLPTSYPIWHSEDRASLYILIIKPKRCSNFSNLFWSRTLHVSYRFFVHHQESSTVYTSIGIYYTGYADCLLTGSGWVPSRPR